MTIVLELILGTSIVLQLCAAVLALWLIRTTGQRFTWIAIAAAILLMVARRVIALVYLSTGHTIHPPDLANEAAGLVISILMLAGVATIGPLFAAIQKSRRELLQSQQTLRQSEERFRELAELAPQAIVEVDTEGRLRWVNQKAIEYSGYTAAELLDGLRLTDQVLPEDQARIEDHMDRVLLGQQPGPVEYAARRKDGSTYPVEAHISPILHDGHVGGFKALVIDITERRQAEAQLSAYRERLRAMAAEAALAQERDRRSLSIQLHDLVSQPLALAKIKLGESRKQVINTDVANTVTAVRTLINDAIDQARILTSELSPPILYELGFEPALEWLCEQTTRRHEVPAKFVFDGESMPVSQEIQVTMFQCTRELLVNIVRHAHASRATVTLRHKGGDVEIEVSDNGVGFEGSSVDSDCKENLGFGLFSIRDRLDLLGGRLEIRSQEGRGTHITLRAPSGHKGTQRQGGSDEHQDSTCG